MHLKYFNIGLLVALVVSSAWLFCKAAPRQGLAKTLFLSARVFVVGAWLIFLSALVYFAFCFPLLGSSKDELVYERESPDKLHIAAVFNRYGGAAVHNTTEVVLRTK